MLKRIVAAWCADSWGRVAMRGRFGLGKAASAASEHGPADAAASLASEQTAARWYAVHARPHYEKIAAAQLRMQSFETFLPLHWKTVRHARRFRDVKAPFFPRYLFVRLDLSWQRWRAVNGTIGVTSLIMEGERPKPVPRGVVEEFLALAGPEGLLSLGPILKTGQKVRVLAGPFANRVGELQRLDENDRVRVLLEVMGGRVAVTATSQVLAPVA